MCGGVHYGEVVRLVYVKRWSCSRGASCVGELGVGGLNERTFYQRCFLWLGECTFNLPALSCFQRTSSNYLRSLHMRGCRGIGCRVGSLASERGRCLSLELSVEQWGACSCQTHASHSFGHPMLLRYLDQERGD